MWEGCQVKCSNTRRIRMQWIKSKNPLTNWPTGPIRPLTTDPDTENPPLAPQVVATFFRICCKFFGPRAEGKGHATAEVSQSPKSWPQQRVFGSVWFCVWLRGLGPIPRPRNPQLTTCPDNALKETTPNYSKK